MATEPRSYPPLLTRELAREFNRQINSILTALSRVIEQSAFDRSDADHESIQEIYLDFQRIIFRFRAISGRLYSQTDFERAAESTFRELAEFLDSSKGYYLNTLRVRIPSARSRPDLDFVHPELHSSRMMSAQEALYLVRESLEAAARGAPYMYREEVPAAEDVEVIAKKIPAQKVAPAQFGVENGKLVVVAQSGTPKADSDDSISQSLEGLLRQGQQIIDSIKAGNYDHRLCAQFEELQRTLASGQNIVRLGLESITAKGVAAAFSDEMADVLIAQIDGHATGIAMYVAQFEEWQTFVQNAAEAAIGDEARKTLTAFVDDLEDQFRRHASAIDPEVPQTIRFLTELISDPKKATKRAIFAFMRTIENLISKSFGFVIETVGKTASKSSDKISDAASTAIVRALVGIGIAGAIGMMPVVSGINGMEWIESAYQVVAEQIAPRLGVF